MSSVRDALRERVPDRNLWVVYLTTLVLSTAYGLALATTPLVLIERDMTDGDIGLTASSFGAGIVSFAVPSGWILRRFSARRTLLVCILGYAAMIALFPFIPHLGLLALDRYADGAFSVGVWVSCETSILLRSRPEHTAFSTSLYAIATGLGYFLGGGLAWGLLHVLTLAHVFVVAAVVAALSSLVGFFLLDPDPPVLRAPPVAATRGSWLGLAYRIKTSSLATFCTGFFQASVVIFLPAYLHFVKGVPERDTTLVTAFSAAGMLVVSNVAGRLGDRHGHLLVLRVLASIGVAVLVSFVPLTSFPVMLAAVTLGGGCLASIPPLSLALQGVIAEPSEYARSSSIFNVFFASGLLVGPFVTGQLSQATSRESILWLFAGLWSALVLVSLVYRKDDPAARRA